MNKLQRLYIALGITGAVGITYVLMALKGMPNELGLEDEEEDDYEF